MVEAWRSGRWGRCFAFGQRLEVGAGGALKTTVGRALVSAALPAALEPIDAPLDAKAIGALFDAARLVLSGLRLQRMRAQLVALGQVLAIGRLSISMDSLQEPDEREEVLQEVRACLREARSMYQEGLITDGERYNKSVDIWSRAIEFIRDKASKRTLVALRRDSGQRRGAHGDQRFRLESHRLFSGAPGDRQCRFGSLAA